jgi:CheY-like chemotaxis protein
MLRKIYNELVKTEYSDSLFFILKDMHDESKRIISNNDVPHKEGLEIAEHISEMRSLIEELEEHEKQKDVDERRTRSIQYLKECYQDLEYIVREKIGAHERGIHEPPVVCNGKVLLMDDEEIVRICVKRMLADLDYEVKLAECGEAAIEFYTESLETGSKFDVVILDLKIKGGTGGKETILKLREIDPKVKAIASSGYLYDPVMTDHKRHGFDEVVTKPYRIHTLNEILHKMITGNNS